MDSETNMNDELDFTIFEKPLGKLCGQIREASDVAEKLAIAKAGLAMHSEKKFQELSHNQDIPEIVSKLELVDHVDQEGVTEQDLFLQS